MDVEAFRQKLASWDLPLGPFREPEDIDREMQQSALEMGPAAAPVLSDLAVEIERQGAPERDVFLEFIEFYARRFPEALAASLLERLNAKGPPLLVFALGSTGRPGVSHRLLSVLDLNTADDDLLEALACTLGELRDSESIKALQALQHRPNLSKRVSDEIDIALRRS